MRRYFICVISTILIAILLLVLAAKGSEYYTDSLNEKYSELYKENATGVSAPWYEGGYHIIDGHFIKDLGEMRQENKKVVSIGSSVSVISFNQDVAAGDNEYEYRFLTCGNGSYKSDVILYDLLKAQEVLTDDDIVKLEVSFSTFRDPGTTITETMLDKWGKYEVEYNEEGDNFTVRECTPLLAPIYYINTCLIRIQSTWQLAMDYIDQCLHGSHGTGLSARANEFGSFQNPDYDDVIIPGNFRNNYYNPEAEAETLQMSDTGKITLLNLMDDISSENSLVVELSPFPPNLATTDFGREYCEYLDNELIPYLNEKGIEYFDFREDFEQSEYADGVHLGYEAGIKYTQMIVDRIQ